MNFRLSLYWVFVLLMLEAAAWRCWGRWTYGVGQWWPDIELACSVLLSSVQDVPAWDGGH
jgi:hypothetical protein